MKNHSCSITDPNHFEPINDNPKLCLYNEIYFCQAYAFNEIAQVLKGHCGAEISRNLNENLLQYFETIQNTSTLVCSYLACIDDGEVDLGPLHSMLIKRHGCFVLPVLLENRLCYKRITSNRFTKALQHSSELKVQQVVDESIPEVSLAEITHMLVPGVPLMTHPPQPQHTGWILPRHPHGYDYIMNQAKHMESTTKFIGVGVCPTFIHYADLFEQELKKPKLDVLITPSQCIDFSCS